MEVTITEAAAALGFRSRSTLSRLLRQGLLTNWERTGPKGQRLLELDGLQGQVQRFVRLQANTPRHSRTASPTRASEPQERPASSDFWDQVASMANGYLEPSCWGPPPWPADRWVSLWHVMDMAIGNVKQDCCGPPGCSEDPAE